jgi:hypothetical protein
MRNIYIKLFFGLIYFLISLSVNAQPTIEWVRRFNSSDTLSDYIVDMKLDKEGNVYVSGYIANSDTTHSFLTLKYNSKGDFQWSRTYNCLSGWDELSGIDVDSLGNVYVCGRSDTVNYALYNRTYFRTIKYSSNGDLLWVRRYINEDSLYAIPKAICIDDSLNVYVTGTCYRNGNSDYITIKYNTNGEFQWEKFYGVSNYDVPRSIIYKNNFIYITGQTDTIYGNTLKYDRNGNRIWITNFSHIGKKISVSDSNYLFIGGGGLVNSREAFRTNKYDSNGSILWSKIFYDTNWYNPSDYLSDMCIDRNSNIYVTGWCTRDAPYGYCYSTIKYNSLGDSVWTRIYHNIFAVNPSDDMAESIATDKSGNVYVTGSTDSNFIYYKFCTIKYDSNGVKKWVAKYPVGLEFTSYYAKFIKLDLEGNMYIVGESEGNGTGDDIIILKYSNITGINNISNEIPQQFKLFQNYPNPFNPTTNIRYQIGKSENGKWKEENGLVTLKVYGVLGKEIATLINQKQSPGIYEVKFDCTSFATGVYFYRLIADGNIIDTKKLVLIK